MGALQCRHMQSCGGILVAGAEALHGHGEDLVLCQSGASGQQEHRASNSRCCGSGGLGLGQSMGVLGQAG